MDSVAENVTALAGVADRIGGWALAVIIIVVLMAAIRRLYLDGQSREREQTEALQSLSHSLRELSDMVRRQT